MKIQHRIILVFAVLTIAIVVAISLLEYYFSNQQTFEDFYKRLEIRAIVAAKAEFEKAGMGQNAYEELRKEHLEKLPFEKEYFISFDSLSHDMDRQRLQVSANFIQEAFQKGKARRREGDMFYYGYQYSSQNRKYVIVISAGNHLLDSYLGNLRRNILISVAFTLVIAVFTGLWFSKLILKPLRIITQKMKEISATQLHLRLPAGTGKDEMAELSGTFNNMLDRLEATFETQKNFISNASHELNTPLTAIIGESEYALNRPRTQSEYGDSLAVILSEAERLKKITGSLLQLAQTGYNGKSQEFEMMRIDEVLYEVKEIVENLIPESRISINLELMPEDQNKLLIKANPQLLELALVNVLVNACKYSNNKPVQISIAAANAHIFVIIDDQGIGIPEKELPYIYEPFFRASNTGKFNGYGIGLPLARNIFRLHNSILEVSSQEGIGTRIKLTIPLFMA